MNLFTSVEFIKIYALIGEKKAEAPIGRVLLLGLLGGFFISMGGAVTNTVTHTLINVGLIRMISGLLFPFGLITVILTGTDLFTGNCLIGISVLEKRATLAGMLKNLIAVYIGNFVGSVAMAAGCVYFGQMSYSAGALAEYAIKFATLKCSLPFENALVMGIMCNILVCAGVMMALCAKDVVGRAIGAYIPVATFVMCGFEHCVANMFFIPTGLLALTVPAYAARAAEAGIDTSFLTWQRFLLQNLLPVTLGNLIGGAGFGAAIWAGNRLKRAENQQGGL
jgi:formate/nitrite transporter